MELAQARILVVGATGVLGTALTERLADRGAQLVLTGRRADALADLATRTRASSSTVLDIIDVEACAQAVRDAAEHLGGLDALVIASGVAAFGPGRDDSDVVVEELFAVNTLGPMALIRAALPLLQKGSAIAVLTAVLADVPTAQMAAYSASKAALSTYLTALRREVRADGVSILDARPPHLETGLAERALAGQPPRMPAGHDIDEVADLIIEGLATGKRELVADLSAHTVTLR